MGFSAPWADSLDIIPLQKLKKRLGINPMGLSAHFGGLSLNCLPCRQLNKLPRINPMGLIAPSVDSLEIISLQKLK